MYVGGGTTTVLEKIRNRSISAIYVLGPCCHFGGERAGPLHSTRKGVASPAFSHGFKHVKFTQRKLLAKLCGIQRFSAHRTDTSTRAAQPAVGFCNPRGLSVTASWLLRLTKRAAPHALTRNPCASYKCISAPPGRVPSAAVMSLSFSLSRRSSANAAALSGSILHSRTRSAVSGGNRFSGRGGADHTAVLFVSCEKRVALPRGSVHAAVHKSAGASSQRLCAHARQRLGDPSTQPVSAEVFVTSTYADTYPASEKFREAHETIVWGLEDAELLDGA